jgi:hypothetical protein
MPYAPHGIYPQPLYLTKIRLVKKYMLASALCLAWVGAAAQTDYAITAKGDTVRGDLKLLSYDLLDRLQVGSGRDKILFKAFEVREAVLDNERYRPVLWDNAYRLMKVIKDGYLSMLAFRLPNQTMFDGRMLMKKDGSKVELPNLAFKKIVASFVTECESVETKIKDGTLGRKDIDAIIDEFNECIAGRTALAKREARVDISLVDQLAAFQKQVETAAVAKDAQDMLADILDKVKQKGEVPNYLVEAFRSSLAAQPALQTQWDALYAKIKK